MGQPDANNLKELFRKAAEIASAVPESMHEAAFNRALDQLLGEGSGDNESKTARRSSQAAKRQAAEGKDATSLDVDKIDRTKYSKVTSSLSVLDRSLWVLKIARDDLDVDGLTPTEIADVLSKKFRVSTSMRQVSDKLGSAGTLVDRRKGARGYVYRLMDAGDRRLAGDTGSISKVRRSRKPKKKKASSPRPGGHSSGRRTATKGGRPGPKKMIEDFLGAGFFSTGRTISEIIKHAEVKLARKYKATDLSPALVRVVRDKKLERAKNENGQYEYSARAS